MANSTPRIDEMVLIDQAGAASTIVVGSAAWYAWLEDATAFVFTSGQGGFSARKQRSGQVGWHWKAFRKHNGTLRHVHLGESAELTRERLLIVAAELAGRATQPPGINAIAPGDPATPAADKPLHIPNGHLPTGTLTFCFTDIEGSTQLWEQHSQAMRVALAHHDAILLQAIESHRGVVFKTVGDGIHAVFVRAVDAVTALHRAQHVLQATDWGELGSLRVRMALHTGAADLRDGDYFGPPLNRVARILALGHGGQILLSHATRDLVADDLPEQMELQLLGEYSLKDLSRPEQIFQLVHPDLPDEFPPLDARNARAAPAPPSPFELLATKLYMPLPRPQRVARERLVGRLHSVLTSKLTLIAAPAGFGKTTLLAEWLTARTEGRGLRNEALTGSLSPHSSVLSPRVAWLSLDAEDNDATRFWSYVIAAIETVFPASGAAALAMLRSPQPPPLNIIVTSLLNAITPVPTEAVLILDDYHLISTPAIHAAITFLLEHLPPQLHLVVLTRADPPLPLTRLRSRGELTELRASDLRFTAQEATDFLTVMMQLPLSSDQVAALEARTEGWVAGLQLAALAMQGRADPAGFVAAFSGSNRFIVDYLVEEVLSRLPAHLQTFVLQTSILNQLCGSLCDAVLGLTEDERPKTKDAKESPFVLRPSSFVGEAYSQLILDQLDRANLFLIPLDDERRWYRYHHLFAEVLRARLHGGAAASEVAALHQRASAWFEHQELLPEAIHHALQAQDWECAGRLIEQCAWPVVYRGQIHTVLGWFEALPAAFLRVRPTLCVFHALLLIHINRLEDAEARLKEAEQGLLPDMPEELVRSVQGRILTTRANIRFYYGDLPQSVMLGQQALDIFPETANLPRAAALAFAAQAFLVTGDVASAVERQVAAVAPAARAAGNRFVQLRGYTLLAELQVLQGRLRSAAATYREAALLAPEPTGIQSMIGSAAYYFGLGDLYREWNDLAAAEQLLVEGMDRAIGAVTANAFYLSMGFHGLARLQHARGDHAGADATLRRLADLGRQRAFDPLVLAHVVAVRARLALAQGDLEAAADWAATSGLRADDDLRFPHELEYLTLARVLIAQGRAASIAPFLQDALALLDRLLAAAEGSARSGSAIEILMLRALAVQAQGNTAGALTALARALTLAAPEGYVRIFVDEGAPMAALLAQVARGESPIARYAATLLDAFPRTEGQGLRTEPRDAVSVLGPQSSVLVEPLSARELEILHLIADGHSNQAIADMLIIALSTVKRHINNIYGKLDVQSRTQALLRARELDLL